jgi:hypothetical protein
MLRESITAMVGSWGPYASLCGISLVAFKLLKPWLKDLGRRLASTLPTRRGMARQGPLIFAFSCLGILLYGATKIPKYAIVTEHHVAILERLSDGDFAFTSDEEPNGGAYRVCPDDAHNGIDTTSILNQGVGYIADYAVWEEQGKCKSIVHADLGFWFVDAANNFKYVKIKGD